MVMNKTTKARNKAPASKATKAKKAAKLPAKGTSNGHKDDEEILDNTEVVSNESAQAIVNGHADNNDSQTSNKDEPNVRNDIMEDTPGDTENAGAIEEILTVLPTKKTRGRPKKVKENDTDSAEVPEAVVTSKATKAQKRKAPEVEGDTQHAGEEVPDAVAGPSTLSYRPDKNKNGSNFTRSVGVKAKVEQARKSITAQKTKAKRQRVVLEVPPVRPISGKVFVMGENDVGQLGLEGVEMKKRPAMLDFPQGFVDVAAGGMHSVCLTETGEVITFGCNDEGALGRLTADDSLEGKPLKVDIPEKVVQISAGDSHSAALTESGRVYLWGNFRNGDGPMGLTVSCMKQPTPIRILNDVTVVKISSGTEHLACLSNNGLIYTLGCAENGQLGRIARHNSHNGGRKGLATLLNPAQVHVGSRFIAIDDVWTGSYNTYMKAQETGSIYAVGLNNYQQLGCGKKNTDDNSIFTPKRIASFNGNTWLRITGGQHHSLALDDNGSVYSLGRGDYGRLGLGERCEEKSVPTIIPTLEDKKCTDISCGNCVSFALTEEGSVFSWGMGDNHQLGHGNDKDCHVPEVIKGNFLESWKAYKVSGGGQHTLILAVPKEVSKEDKKK